MKKFVQILFVSLVMLVSMSFTTSVPNQQPVASMEVVQVDCVSMLPVPSLYTVTWLADHRMYPGIIFGDSQSCADMEEVNNFIGMYCDGIMGNTWFRWWVYFNGNMISWGEWHEGDPELPVPIPVPEE